MLHEKKEKLDEVPLEKYQSLKPGKSPWPHKSQYVEMKEKIRYTHHFPRMGEDKIALLPFPHRKKSLKESGEGLLLQEEKAFPESARARKSQQCLFHKKGVLGLYIQGMKGKKSY